MSIGVIGTFMSYSKMFYYVKKKKTFGLTGNDDLEKPDFICRKLSQNQEFTLVAQVYIQLNKRENESRRKKKA